MSKDIKSKDFEIARNLDKIVNRIGLTENAVLLEGYGEDYHPRTLIDQTLELIDPTPNVHSLFVQFNERFFRNVLLPVEVKWSNRMTSCAGTCSFHPRNRQCIITLSAPLLKLRPRKDLVETLLHEMIHAYLFLTNNNRDRDGHGPEFCKHMHRINQIAGTKITIYHSFHEEVRVHQQHWWRCNGPCQQRAPFFGMVRRAMNRAPGPSDFWWGEHRKNCNGEFIKIKEPENYKAKNANPKTKKGLATKPNVNEISNWLKKSSSGHNTIASPLTPKISKSNQSNTSTLTQFKKLGNNANNVYGFGTGGPGSSKDSQRLQFTPTVSSSPKISSGRTIGGSNSGISILLTKASTKIKPATISSLPKDNKSSQKTIDSWSNSTKMNTPKRNSLNDSLMEMVECPVCGNLISKQEINRHANTCLDENQEKEDHVVGKYSNIIKETSIVAGKRKPSTIETPRKQLRLDFSTEKRTVNRKSIDDDRLSHKSVSDNNLPIQSNDEIQNSSINDSIISISDSSDPDICSSPKCSGTASSSSKSKNISDISILDNGHKCLVCHKYIKSGMSLSDHLDDCIGTIFEDDIDSDKTSADKLSLCGDTMYPCPVCTKMIEKDRMNEHLDQCLT